MSRKAPKGIARVPTELMDLAKLKPGPYNPREISEEALEGLGQSLEQFGLVQDLVWNKRTGNLVGGHQRLRILLDRGESKADVKVVDLSEEDEKLLNLSLNNEAIQGTWSPLLTDVLKDLKALPASALERLRIPELELKLPTADPGRNVNFQAFGKDAAKGIKKVECTKCHHKFVPR